MRRPLGTLTGTATALLLSVVTQAEAQEQLPSAPAPAPAPTPESIPQSPIASTPAPPVAPIPALSPAPPRVQPQLAAAPSQRHRPLELGTRFGVAFPMGHFQASSALSSSLLSNVFSYKIPILIEAGYEVTQSLMLGIEVQYGFIVDKRAACGNGNPCSDHDLELGIQGQYHFAPRQPIDPWFSAGVGYEIESYSTAVLGETYSGARQGPQFVKLQGGADFQLAHVMTVGPFLGFSVAEYTTETSEGISNNIPSPTLHEWLSLGVKGTFKIGS